MGDIFLIKLPDRPQPFYLLKSVLEVILGFDNKIRGVEHMQVDGGTFHHSIYHLYPLELSLTHDTTSVGTLKDEETVVHAIADPIKSVKTVCCSGYDKSGKYSINCKYIF